MIQSSSRDTDEYTPPPSPGEISPPAAVSANIHVDVAALSHQGKVRENNEDHYLVTRCERSMQTLMTNLPEGLIPKRFAEVGYAMLVADGMGGQAAGEVASRLAITTLVNLVLQTPDWIMRGGEQEAEQVMQRMADRYKVVDATVREQAQSDPALRGMGTTMTLACNLGTLLILTHIGDSRVYLQRGKECHQLTRDHTMVQGLVELGIIKPEQASSHRLKHALTRVIGAGESLGDAEVQQLNLIDGDQVLLCTDGLSDMVKQEAIAGILRDSKSVKEACRLLVEAAMENGGVDNVTVVLARYHLPKDLSVSSGA
ncbi:MAG TPA: protein phosphatase 2C domain-containing protein [Gemmataceae bacterium]|jgi:protein phosphatase|nr:protein phosphatase 2C domain-containing protein [Gemmataceae bacterium]